jgi:intracellular sulfur oxidation DsrE/DsrF family protein
MKLGAPYHHALVMKKTGRLEDVAIVVYGRAVAAVSTQVKSIPETLQAEIKATLEAGIHVYVCATALEKAGIAKEALIPGVEVVPQGAAKIAELVSQNSVPMQY